MATDETRIALIGIIIEDPSCTEELNSILHDYSDIVVGRMGIPYRSKGVSIISLVVDASIDITSSLAGKLGMLPGVNVKTVYSKK